MSPFRFGIGMALLALAARAGAQDQTGQVSGTVYDSVARAPLRGAIVQMVASTGAPLFTDSSDARGRFTFRGVPAGQYLIEFTHRVLDSLALTPPLTTIAVSAGENTRVALSVPSPATIITQTCRSAPADSATLFFGMLRDARTKAPIDSGQVIIRWTELLITAGGLNFSQKNSSARTSGEGWFATCMVPAGADIVVQAAHGDDSTGMAIVTMPKDGLLRFDLDVGGVATLRGRVTSQGRPVYNAWVRVGNEQRAAFTDTAGQYRLSGVAAGTQTVDVRALGYAPDASPVNLAPDAETEKNVELTTVKRVLDTIRVIGQRVYSIDAIGFEKRRKSTGGTFFDAETVRRRAPYSLLQLFNQIPSLRITQSGFDRTISMRGGATESCTPAFFLNGAEMPAEFLGDVDMLARPEEVEGIEIYRGMTIPPQFHRIGACGAIVLWTRRSPRRAR